VLGGTAPPAAEDDKAQPPQPRSASGRAEELTITVSRNSHCILLKAEINGRPVTLVLDTGASNTILSSELVGPASTPFPISPLKGSGLVGSGRWRRATIRIGSMIWVDHRVLEMGGLQDVSRSLRERVDGILGEDLLTDFKMVVINYQDRTLTLAR
jgi:hypothetical protein